MIYDVVFLFMRNTALRQALFLNGFLVGSSMMFETVFQPGVTKECFLEADHLTL